MSKASNVVCILFSLLLLYWSVRSSDAYWFLFCGLPQQLSSLLLQVNISGLLSEVGVWVGKRLCINHAVNTVRPLWPLLNVDLAMMEKAWTFHLQSILKSNIAKCLLTDPGWTWHPAMVFHAIPFKILSFLLPRIHFTYKSSYCRDRQEIRTHMILSDYQIFSLKQESSSSFRMSQTVRYLRLASPEVIIPRQFNTTTDEVWPHICSLCLQRRLSKLESFLKSLAAICRQTFESEICCVLMNFRATHIHQCLLKTANQTENMAANVKTYYVTPIIVRLLLMFVIFLASNKHILHCYYL